MVNCTICGQEDHMMDILRDSFAVPDIGLICWECTCSINKYKDHRQMQLVDKMQRDPEYKRQQMLDEMRGDVKKFVVCLKEKHQNPKSWVHKLRLLCCYK